MRYLFLTAVLLTSGVSAPASAQQSELLHIVIMQGTPRGKTPTEIRLTSAPDARNVIVVDRRATAAEVEGAVRVVQDLRARFGDTLSKEIRAVPKPPGAKPKAGSREAKLQASLAKSLVELDRKTPANVRGLGSVKYMDLIVDRLPRNPTKPNGKN